MNDIYYFRFVDDMIFIFPPHISPQIILNKLDNLLSDLSLTRSIKKTSEVLPASDFLLLVEEDTQINDLSKRFMFLFSDVYQLRKSYANLLNTDWWRFIDCYQNLLTLVCIYLDKARLSRKLRKYQGWWARFTSLPKIYLPDVNKFDDLENTEVWLKIFEIENLKKPNSWITKRYELSCDTKTMFIEALEVLRASQNEIEIARAKKRFKFSINRLGRLGYEELTNTIIKILVETPWMINIRRVCDDLALQRKETELFIALKKLEPREEDEWGSIRANIMKSLSKLKSLSNESIATIENFAFNARTDGEKLIASEILFMFKTNIQKTKTFVKKSFEIRHQHVLIAKNYVFLYSKSKGKFKGLIINPRVRPSVIEAMQIVKSEKDLPYLYREEPDILRQNFYEGDYRDDESEFEDIPSDAF